MKDTDYTYKLMVRLYQLLDRGQRYHDAVLDRPLVKSVKEFLIGLWQIGKEKKMTRKRFEKLLIARGMQPNAARYIAGRMKQTYHLMEKHACFILDESQSNKFYADDTQTERLGFKPYKIFPYAETYRMLVEKGFIYV